MPACIVACLPSLSRPIIPCGSVCLRALISAIVQGVLEIVGSELRLFNEVNLATAVSRVAKLCDRTVGLASAAQDPAFVQLKATVSAPQAILCLRPCC